MSTKANDMSAKSGHSLSVAAFRSHTVCGWFAKFTRAYERLSYWRTGGIPHARLLCRAVPTSRISRSSGLAKRSIVVDPGWLGWTPSTTTALSHSPMRRLYLPWCAAAFPSGRTCCDKDHSRQKSERRRGLRIKANTTWSRNGAGFETPLRLCRESSTSDGDVCFAEGMRVW